MPTEEPPPSGIAAQGPEASPTAAEGVTADDGSLGWLWLLLGVAAAIVALVVARRSRARRTTSWRDRARVASSKGIALHDRIAAELAVAGSPARLTTNVWDEAVTAIDALAADVHELRLSAPDSATQERALAFATALDRLRSIVLVERTSSSSGGAHAAGRSEADATVRSRLEGFHKEIGMFEAAVFGHAGAPPPTA